MALTSLVQKFPEASTRYCIGSLKWFNVELLSVLNRVFHGSEQEVEFAGCRYDLYYIVQPLVDCRRVVSGRIVNLFPEMMNGQIPAYRTPARCITCSKSFK